ncbi:hypothetical protein [Sphingomonas sp. VNH70]|uniref:hypothetical protein n=1 Tax=Sphingomonas silueang TaxID=3156617 RepID=UPI0032B48E8C
MSRPLSPRTVRRLARAVAACVGGAIGGVLFGHPELAAITVGIAVAIVLSAFLHLHRAPKGKR